MKKIFYVIAITLLTVFIFPLGANATTTADANWNNIVSLMKNNQSLAEFYEDTITITSDDTQMIITVNYDFGDTSVVTYYRYNDMVTLESANTENSILFALDECIINREFLYAVAETYGYDGAMLSVWAEYADYAELNYAEDGIEFTPYTLTEEEITTTTFKNLKINIDCGISAFEEEDITIPEQPEVPEEPEKPTEPSKPEEPKDDVEKPVENPNTGLYVSLGVVVISLLSLIIFAFSKKKNYFSKI